MNKPKVQKRLEIKNEGDITKLYIYGVIKEKFWWESEDDGISSKEVLKVLEDATGERLEVHINSRGGDVFESIAICNTLKQFDGKVDVIIDGEASSGASVIAMAGDTVTMFSNSMMMIHKAWTYTYGNSDELRKVADDLVKIDTAVLTSYQSRFVGTEDELKDLLKEETWLTAEECLTLGLCDRVLDKKKESEPQNNVKQNLLAKYKKDNGTEKGSFFDPFIKNEE